MKNKTILVALAVYFLTAGCDSSDPNPGFELTKQSGTIQTIAGKGPNQFGHDGDGGIATKATIGWVNGITLDGEGNLYLADGAANTIRRITIANGQINTMAGAFRGYNINDLTPDAGDNGNAIEAHLNIPFDIAVDANNNLYIVDTGNNKIRNVENTIINFVAGSVFSGYEGDGDVATSAKFFAPQGIAVDSENNIYISDTQNHVVRKIDAASGKITTVAGVGPNNAGYSGDGGSATNANLNLPRGLAIDALGNLFIADSQNNVIRKVSDGIITTIAGTGSEGYSGDGGSATSAMLRDCHGVAIDGEGVLYIADTGNTVIRRVDTNGTITTYAGNGTYGYSGDGGPSTSAQLNVPMDVVVDALGNLYIADTNNSAIRFVAK